MIKRLIFGLGLMAVLGCDPLWGNSSLGGDWYVQETNIVFRIHSQGDRFAVSFPHEELGAKGSLDGTSTYPGTLRLTIPYRMAPQITATVSYIADYSSATQGFKGTYSFQSSLPATARQGEFHASKIP